MFIIGGVQSKTVTLENRMDPCPVCSHNMLSLQRTDQYISLFFIPLIRYKKGEPYLNCRNCNSLLNVDNR